MRRSRTRLAGSIDSAMAAASVRFMDAWAVVERGYRRPLSRVAGRLRYAFYPLLAVLMLGWLGWDWQHERSLGAAEDAVFDRIIGLRPVEPRPSGRTVVVEIDDCSIEYFRARGEGGWPWSRERHADLLDALDRAGVRAVGIDILFADRSTTDPAGDALLEATAAAGEGRFLFAATRIHADFDEASLLRADDAPGAFPLSADATRPAPRVSMIRPYGEAMARHSGLVNVRRGEDGLLRDVHLYAAADGWAIPTLPLRLAAIAGVDIDAAVAARAGELRINWRTRSQLPYASAADLLAGEPVCGGTLPPLEGRVVLLGHIAAGINDAKPTPVDMAMPGVTILAEATEALLTGSWIRMPPGWLKYLLAGCLVLLSCFVFWRGEPHTDVDPVFVALNLVLLAIAFVGLSAFGWFIDIFASLGYGALCFGLCRGYAAVQRGRATGNSDYLPEYDPAARPWVLLARLRLEPDPRLSRQALKRQRREYRRALRRLACSGEDIVLVEGLVERKHWMQALLDDQVLLTWTGASEAEARARTARDLDVLHAALEASGGIGTGRGHVMACTAAANVGGTTGERSDDDGASEESGRRLRLRALLGQDLDRLEQRPLASRNSLAATRTTLQRKPACDTRSTA